MRLRRKHPSDQSPVPCTESPRPAADFAVPVPNFRRRSSAQVLMRPRMVVPAAKRDQLGAQLVAIGDRDAIELLLERAE